MHFKGVELTKQRAVKYCSDNTCTNLIPICCLFLTPECSDNSTKWHHLSAGEHVCSVCYNHLHSFFSYENENPEITSWKQSWLTQSHEAPTIYDYITTKLLSNWYLCCDCGKWRQTSRDIALTPADVNQFSCKMTLRHSKAPCNIPEDKRIEFIRVHPGPFFDSVKYTVYLASSPYLHVYDEYSLDTVGISPTAQTVDFDLGDPCRGFMTHFNPFLKEHNVQTTAGAIDPVSMDKWEHAFFPTFTGNLKNIFIGLRNLMLLLWAADPKRPISANLVGKCLQVQGLAKVALLINSVPDMIRIYSGFGFFNFGFPSSGCATFFEDSKKIDVVVIGAGLSGLTAARHLSLLGANVTVVEADEAIHCDGIDRPMPRKLRTFDWLNEVYGTVNNPFSVMAYQCDVAMREVSTNLTILNADGSVIEDEEDRFCQNLVYDFVAYLMEGSSVIRNASTYEGWSLGDLYREYRRSRIASKGSEHSDGVENVYLSEIEYRVCGGASMENVARNIEMPTLARGMFNFSCCQFSGTTAEPAEGHWGGLFQRLVAGVGADIRYGKRVSAVRQVSGNRYCVSTDAGDRFEADKVVVAVSPPQIATVAWDFDWGWGECSDNRRQAPVAPFIIAQLAFAPTDLFWRAKVAADTAFAIVPRDTDHRGFCHLFKEVRVVRGMTVLQTHIFGLAASDCSALTDADIAAKVLEKLSCLADGGVVPQPVWSEMIRLQNALMSCTEAGDRYHRGKVADNFAGDIFVTRKGQILAEPISLTSSFCAGMDTASSLLRNAV